MGAYGWTALAIALYGAFLSTLLALRQVLQERRRLRVLAQRLIWVQREGDFLDVLEVRAICEGRRPVYVFSAGVITEDAGIFHPASLPLHRGIRGSGVAPALLNDGEGVTFYFDLLDFEDPRARPKAVWVRDQGDREYKKRLSRKQRRELPEQLRKLRERLGPEIDSQRELLRPQTRDHRHSSRP